MFHVILGTKGQLIKMVPVIREFMVRRIPFKLIHAGQHAQIFSKLLRVFDLPQPDFNLVHRREDVLNLRQGLFWLTRSILTSARTASQIRCQSGIVITHGDAPPALVALVVGRVAGQKVAHVEAGLRSFNFLEPFPEEFVRVLVDKFADYLFAPSKFAELTLRQMRVRGQIFNTALNTVIDTIRLTLSMPVTIELPSEPYVVATIHRLETIESRRQLEKIIDILQLISQYHKVLLVLHGPTKEKLKKFQLASRLEKKDLEIRPLLVYPAFMQLIMGSKFVVTDSGGMQEETAYMGKPCLILRNRTERIEGLGSNVVVSKFDRSIIKKFCENYHQFERKSVLDANIYPSRKIVTILQDLMKSY